MKSPLFYLADALAAFGLIMALVLGLDVKWVVLIWLCLEFVSSFCKAFIGVIDPLMSRDDRRS